MATVAATSVPVRFYFILFYQFACVCCLGYGLEVSPAFLPATSHTTLYHHPHAFFSSYPISLPPALYRISATLNGYARAFLPAWLQLHATMVVAWDMGGVCRLRFVSRANSL